MTYTAPDLDGLLEAWEAYQKEQAALPLSQRDWNNDGVFAKKLVEKYEFGIALKTMAIGVGLRHEKFEAKAARVRAAGKDPNRNKDAAILWEGYFQSREIMREVLRKSLPAELHIHDLTIINALIAHEMQEGE